MATPPSPHASEFLQTAERIAERIVHSAEAVDGEGDGSPRATWWVRVPDYGAPVRRSRPEQASGELYQGVAGIVYFLARAHAVTGDPVTADAARAGLAYALDRGRDLPENAFGFHGGRTGIAWVAAHTAELLDRPEWADRGLDLLDPLFGSAQADHGLDVVAGAAGAVPALLDLAHLDLAHLDRARGRRDRLVGLAEELGDHLLATAHPEPGGWSWATVRASSIRHLAGFAHGTAGIAVALLELALATGRGDFRFAADMALLYENAFFDPERGNWPDLRNVPLGELLRAGDQERLRAMARADALPPYRKTFMHAWCHGAPGIGLSRLRAWQLTGCSAYLDQARRALRSTLPTLEPESGERIDFCLCHGVAGNAETALVASELLGDADLRAACASAAERGRERYEPGHWPCGTFDGASDPSLLVGEAGIGLFFLRLADPEIPTPLLVRPEHEADATLPVDGYAEAAEQSLDAFFGASRRRWRRLDERGVDGPAFPLPSFEPGPDPPTATPASVVHDRLRERLEESPTDDPRADASMPDLAAYELTLELKDFSVETRRELVRPSWAELDLAADAPTRFVLAADARLVWTEHDWSAWVSEQAPESLPEAEPTAVLLYRKDNRVHRRELSPLAAVILDAASTAASVPELRRRVAEALGDASPDPATLEGVVRAQVEQLYGAGFLDAGFPDAGFLDDEGLQSGHP